MIWTMDKELHSNQFGFAIPTKTISLLSLANLSAPRKLWKWLLIGNIIEG